MASLINEPNGCRRLEFEFRDARRRIRLGKMPKKLAESFRVRIDALIATASQGLPPDDAGRLWLRDLDAKLLARVIASGLTKADPRRVTTLDQLCDLYFGELTVKATTLTTYKQTEKSLLDHFGKLTELIDVTPVKAEGWRQAMLAKGFAIPTVSKRIKTARGIFAKGVKSRACDVNPFDGLWTGGERNPARLRFITADVARKVLEYIPDTETKLIFALARWGGMRCPSEIAALTWEDVNWERPARLVVHASKTQRDRTGGVRIVPMFDELRPLLLEHFHAAEPGTKWVITPRANAALIWRKRILSAIRRAGVVAWPKLFQNLRATRQTELVDRHPLHLVCAWIGNNAVIAQRHYLQVTDAHLESAMTNPEEAARNAAHQPAPTDTNEPQAEPANPAPLAKNATGRGEGRSLMTPTGSQQPRRLRGFKGRPDQSGAIPGALAALPDEVRMQLAQEAVSDAFAAMARKAGGN